ncbi:MAG: extracellular solute-binding protein [Chloroflexi bacterium]|nr:extracellular solute-binding protein [Chloroflexota bacterium]
MVAEARGTALTRRGAARRALLRKTALGLGALAMAPALSACGMVPGLGGGDKMTIWTDATFAPDSDDYQTEEIQKWAKSKNVEVEITRETGDNVRQKLQAAVESKQLPDISQVDVGRFTVFYPAGIFTDVSDLYAEIGKQWGGFYSPAERTVTKEGKQWTMPYSIDSNLILYRKDLLDAGGFKEAPKTWDEFFTVAQKLQNPPNLYGVGFQFNKAGTDAEDTFNLMMLDHGASVVKDDGKSLNVKTPEMLAFLNRIKSSWELGVYPPGVTGWDNSGNNTALQDEKVIFIHNPASPLVWFRNNKPALLPNIGVSAVPAGPKGQFNTAYVRDGFAVMKTGNQKKVDLSKDLLRYLYGKDVYRKWVGLAFPSPAVSGMEDHEVWKNPQRKGFLDAAKTGVLQGHPGPPTPAYSEFANRQPLISAATRMVVDKWSPEQALDELAKVAEDVFSKYK